MGLKRRGTGRKQVLDLSDKQDSPSRRTWTSKYQQICVEHNPQNGGSSKVSPAILGKPGNATSNNPLSGLIANYNSDSDEEGEDNDNSGDLNSKVSDFLKEIQTIVPSGSSIVVPGQPLTTPGLGPEEILNHPQPASSSAWQECYDETYRSVYYWNMQTNEVTWEMPVDLPAATNAVPKISPPPVQAYASVEVPSWLKQPPAVTNPAPMPLPVLRNKAGRKVTLRSTPVINKLAKGRPTSDSEDEKIEMITSFGQSSEEESEEETIQPATKKKKLASVEATPTAEQPQFGPKLQSPSFSLPAIGPDSMSHKLRHSREIDDLGPPGMEPEFNNERLFADVRPIGVDSNDSSKEALYPIGDQALTESSVSEINSQISSPAMPSPVESEDGETDEVAILSRLKTQALVLKQLGGDLPDDLRELIEPSSNADTPKQEEPTDFEKEMEQMEKELLEITELSKKAIPDESKPTSFALIAGYGDDSDPEDEPTQKTISLENVVPVVKRTFESLPTMPVKTLFPIFDEAQMTPLVSIESRNLLLEAEAAAMPQSVPSSPESAVASTSKPPKEFAISALRLHEASEPTLEPPEPPVQPMIDTSMPVKAGKRKKRLDISTSAELVANAFAAKVHSVKEDNATANLEDTNAEKAIELRESVCEQEETYEHAPKEIKAEVEAEPSPQEKRAAEEERKKEEEMRKSVEELAQLVLEKVNFLGEGKDPVSPVSIMAIKIETLVCAWHKGALLQSYLSKWLGETWEELRRLEAAAAPDGWACQWDRSHKRYYYHNKSSGETQWEYPQAAEEETSAGLGGPGLAGGELEMEICTTPPPPPSPPPRPPSPKTPPPPNISQPLTPPPPSPPRISAVRSYSRSKNAPKGKKKKGNKPDKTAADHSSTKPSDEEPPLPPPPSLSAIPPPLPSNPPPVPPPPPAELPPLPLSPPPRIPTPPPHMVYGEPLPPGVDAVELPFSRPPQPSFELAPSQMMTDGVSQAMAEEQMMGMMHPMQAYMMPTYQQPMAPNVNMGAPMMDYGNIPYMMHTHMAVPAVIAKPPAKKPKAAALHAALDSFYSDLATMDPVKEEVAAEVAPEVAQPAVQLPVDHQATETEPTKPVDQLAKKKKTKKAASQGMKKKKVVSSLVAKWQQVQQDVRRDYKHLGEDQDSDSQ